METYKLILKFRWRHKGPRVNSKIVLEKRKRIYTP